MSEPAAAARDRVRIVDLVFAGGGRGHKRRLALGLAIAAGLYATAFGLLQIVGESAAAWSADMAARIHDAIAVERTVDLTPPPPPPPPPRTPEPPAERAPHPVAQARAPSARARPAAPAQAAAVVTASNEPVDLTGNTIVVGSGPVFAGGTTTASGTNTHAVTGPVAPNGTGTTGGHSLARAVSLDQAAWACPWPADADTLQVNEQTVVIKAVVRPDGRAADVQILSDPGLGFGAAARNCALGTRFQPARNEDGRPIAAPSPPIRVHFYR